MGQEVTPPPSGIEGINLKDALEERYLAYALSTIMHRALPDVRDGLKPVHRRLLYAMRLLKLDPGQGFKKCARVVGDVIGKYHPHGDQAVYDALVRLAQDFAQRYPLIDGQGNFGNVDGDNAAAMRYTEARMTDTAKRLLDGLDEDAVDWRETYDGEDKEPIVLPGGFPNLLGNGSSGIAVGMATSIPPHNAFELCNACQHLIKNPDAEVDELLEHIKGPDFPTGGLLVSDQGSIREAYATGRGSFRVRARWEVEELGRGQWAIVVTEIPYQVQKSRLIEKIAELLIARKLPLLDDVRDESAEDIRVVLVPRSKNVDANILMESLFKLTDLENRFSLNMNVLSMGKVPMVMGVKQVLREWLDHRKVVLVRRSEHRLGQINHRLEVLAGYLIAYLNLDEVIRIIREEDDAKASLIRTFELTDVQAEAILNMRLRSLRKLEEFEIRKEHDKLTDEKDQLTKLLGSDARQWTKISKEIGEIAKVYGPETEIGKRRTDKAEAPEADLVDIQQAMIEKEPITVIISEKGWIRALKGHQVDLSSLSFKQGDKLKLSFHAETTDKILVFSTGGKFFTLGADRLPGGRGHGEPIRLMVEMDEAQDVVSAFVHKPGRSLLLSNNEARGFVVSEDDVVANTRKGKQVLNLTAPSEAALCVDATGDHVAIIGENRKLLVFPLAQIAQMGRGRGVRLQRYRDGNVSDIRVFKGEDGLTWTDSSGRSFTRSLEELSEWLGDRGQAGRLPPTGFPRSNKFGPKTL
ncbi:DNA topoisomerase IV subunit A [Roseibium alexandrii]|uniref:DNA topoisomerase 4 subunit A n=1 Tax=Roseibium alexandrii TaxID=388408 RepID=A0A0M6ZWV7_9HYPH|nr:DNA topoisomerase IV subunit A [Roseibium alexandrii]CTQ66716.1 DNA topoisomerase 4 subunit A [Roseibium alexandrii]